MGLVSVSPGPVAAVLDITEQWGENLILWWLWGSPRAANAQLHLPGLMSAVVLLLGCACSWGGIGRLLSHVPGEDLKLGRSSGDSTPLGGADLLSPVPSAAESHPGAQPLHGDDGGQPEEAPWQRHPRQPQWGHCTQQRRGDQDHLLGEHVRMSLCPTVPPSCCSFLCPPLHSPVGHCVPLMQPGSPPQGWAARVRARGRLEQAVSLGALFKLGSFCGRTKDKLPGVLAPK